MKLLTFRKRGERTIRIGGLSVRGGIVDLTSAYASYLFKRKEPNPIPFANAYIPMDTIEFLKGSWVSSHHWTSECWSRKNDRKGED